MPDEVTELKAKLERVIKLCRMALNYLEPQSYVRRDIVKELNEIEGKE